MSTILELLLVKVLEKAGKSAVDVLADAVRSKNAELRKEAERKEEERKNKGAEAKAKPVRKIDAKFVSQLTGAKSALQQHVAHIQSWCTSVRFTDLKQEKSVKRIYVDLDTYLMPLNTHETPSERKSVRPLFAAIQESPKHCIILGGPGAGKTTSLQKICVDYFDKGKILLNYNFPILIRLRDLSNSTTEHPLHEKLKELLCIHVTFADSKEEERVDLHHFIERQAFNAYLDQLNAAILLDGFDEIASTSVREAVLKDIESLAQGLTMSKLIVTCRSREFRYRIASIAKFEIASLSPTQVELFARRWLTSRDHADDFLEKVNRSPYADTAIRPLTLAHLCAIYERIQDIPDKPRSVYRRVVHLLLEEWDSQREIKRTTAYAGFDADRKLEFLAQLAYVLTTEFQELRFSDDTLKEAYGKIYAEHGLPVNERSRVIEEIESHSGLILESGYKHYEFAHKSLQEFLAADYIIRLPSLAAVSERIALLANELAIATALSSKPATYLCELALRTLSVTSVTNSWHEAFVARLALEKPNLHLGATALSVIAVFSLLSRLENASQAASIFQSLIPPDSARKITEYYSQRETSRGFLIFRRTKTHPQYRLPDVLKVPIKFFT